MDYARHVVEAFITRLKAAVPSVDGRVYTDVPQDEPFPYIVVSLSSDSFAAQDFSGQQHTVRVQVFSRYQGVGEALIIRAQAYDALDRQEAALGALDAGTLIKCEATGTADAFQEDDGKAWQAICEFDVITQ